MRIQRYFGAVVGGAFAASLALATPSAALGWTVWAAELSGDQVVPGPGDPAGTGYVDLEISVETGEACARIEIDGLDTPVAAHLHAGGEGIAGDVVVTLPTPSGELGDCWQEVDPAILEAIIDDPTSYYIDIHTEAYPDGAVRGQLVSAELANVVVAKQVCPSDVSLEDIRAGQTDRCVGAWRPGDFDLPDGHTWNVEPVEFDMEVELLDGADLAYGIADAGLSGGGTCDPDTMVCSGGRAYEFISIFAGLVSVTELTFPDGYDFAWAHVFGSSEGDPPVDYEVDPALSSVTFDAVGLDNFAVILYDVAPAAATPAPSTPAPTAAAPQPTVRITQPPTSSIGERGIAGSDLTAALAVLLLTLVGAAASLRSARHRIR